MDAPTGSNFRTPLVNAQQEIERAWRSAVEAVPKPEAAQLDNQVIQVSLDVDMTLEGGREGTRENTNAQPFRSLLPGTSCPAARCSIAPANDTPAARLSPRAGLRPSLPHAVGAIGMRGHHDMEAQRGASPGTDWGVPLAPAPRAHMLIRQQIAQLRVRACHQDLHVRGIGPE